MIFNISLKSQNISSVPLNYMACHILSFVVLYSSSYFMCQYVSIVRLSFHRQRPVITHTHQRFICKRRLQVITVHRLFRILAV